MNKRLMMAVLSGVFIVSTMTSFAGGTLYASSVQVRTEKEEKSSVDWKSSQLLPIKDRDMLIQIYKDKHIIGKDRIAVYDGGVRKSSVQDLAVAEQSSASAEGNSYSTTNVQVQGVDEADIVKNDGRYIYAIKENGKAISIVDTKDNLQEIGTIKEEEKFSKLFIDDNQLIAIGQMTEDRITEDDSKVVLSSNSKMISPEYRDSRIFTVVKVFDISDRKSPKSIRTVKIQGRINEVRKIQDKLYVMTQDYKNCIDEKAITDDKLLTYYSDTKGTNDNLQPISFDDMYYEPWAKEYTQVNVLSVIPIDEKNKADFKVILGSDETVYMNEQNLYLVNMIYGRQYNKQVSYITKFSVDGTQLTYKATGDVNGRILNQFSMDEYKGNFRIATTDSNRDNNIYILDSNLNRIGAITKLAPGERIYSARFEGNRGYLVTYKETDPLFVFDLTNPRQPKTLGKLKIPGFSQYLHPLGDDLVVGIGRATSDIIIKNEDGTETSGGTRIEGIKLSLFNVKNPQKPVEINHIILGEMGSYSSALNNHNVVMVNKDKKMLAIPIYLRFSDKTNFNGAYVFEVENGKLVGKAKLGRLINTESYYQEDSRICYIGNKMYYIYDDTINMYSLENFKRIKTIYLLK